MRIISYYDISANTVYGNQQNVSGGSTPVPSINQSFGAAAAPSGSFGSTGNISNLGIGPLSSGIPLQKFSCSRIA